MIEEKKEANGAETSFYGEEPPPDPEDYTTKEEEERNRILMIRLKEQQTKAREWKKQMELEEKIKKEMEKEKRDKELRANKEYLDRRNKSAKFRARENNERIEKLLNKVDAYMQRIKNLDSIDKIKRQAEKEYEEEIAKKKKKKKITQEEIEHLAKLNNKNANLRNENKQKILDRKKAEEEKRKKLEIAKKANERAQKILREGFQSSKPIEEESLNKTNKNNNNVFGMFQIEEEIGGTNLSPDMMNNNMNNIINDSISSKNKKTTVLPRINENSNEYAEMELRKILKNNPYDLKKLTEFKKKYKYFDISAYIHTAKMNQIKSGKVVRRTINNTTNNFNVQLKPNENDEVEFPNYLSACKYNNSEYIQANLLRAKNDIEVYLMLNEKDEFDRNGLMYLIIHNNLTMIKLTLLSGVVLSDCTDIYGRNLIHYCCTEYSSADLLDKICHCIDFENKNDYLGMKKYIEKCFKTNSDEDLENDNSESYRNECENRIKKFDNLIENKNLAMKPEEVIKKRQEEEIKRENNKLNIDGNLEEFESKNKNKKNLISAVITNNTDMIEEIKKKQIPIKKLVNSADIDGNYPLHYVCQQNDLDKIEVLVYYHTKFDLYDQQGKRPIDITSSDVIQQYLLKNEANFNSKKGKNQSNINVKNNISQNPNLSNISMNNISSLDIEKLKFYSTKKINEFTSGYENNNYLILSVLINNFDLFRFLIKDKNCRVDFLNSNGWTVLHFILKNKYWAYFSFVFNLPSSCDSPEKIFESLSEKQLYDDVEIFKENDELTSLGQAIKIIDTLTNNNTNLLSMCIDDLNDLNMLKAILILYENQIHFFEDASPLDIVMNRQYGKNKEPLLVKAVNKDNIKMLKYFLINLQKKQKFCSFEITQGDKLNQNILHRAVINKNKDIIKFLTRYDSDKNELKEQKDSKGKSPSDYDRVKSFTYELISIWDASKNNDLDALEKLVNELKYYKINAQKKNNGNTALHIAAKNYSDKAALFLVKNGIDINIKNWYDQTALEYIQEDKDIKNSWIKKFKRIINGDVKDYVYLNESISSKANESNISKISEKKPKKKNLKDEVKENKKLNEILQKIRKVFNEREINPKKLFEKLDKYGNGVLNGKEFKDLFIVLDIENVSYEDFLLLNSFLDKNKDGLIQYSEFITLLNE